LKNRLSPLVPDEAEEVRRKEEAAREQLREAESEARETLEEAEQLEESTPERDDDSA
jgi:hypothetical protein